MKKFTAFTLALVLILICLSAVACNGTVLVYLHANDGSATQMQAYDDSFVLPTPDRDGYTFDGWWLDEHFVQPFTSGQKMTESFHLYAKWTPDVTIEKVTVTFVYNNGIDDIYSVELNAGETVTFPEPPVWDGHIFTGWYIGAQSDVQWLENQPVNSNLTLYAHWNDVAADQVTVRFEAHAQGIDDPAPVTVDKGAPVTLPTLSRQGYTFDGWFDAAEGGNKVGEANSSYTAQSDVTLHAHWTQIVDKQQVTVTFIANLSGLSNPQPQNVSQGTRVTLPTLSAEGYTCNGWFDAAQGGNKVGEAGGSYTASSDITLYAQWTQNTAPQYVTVTFIANATGLTNPTPRTVTQGTQITLPTISRSNYTLDGWYTSAQGGTPVGAAGGSYTANATITLYAHWTAVGGGNTGSTIPNGNGTQSSPYNASGANAQFAGLASGSYSSTAVYVKGYVVSQNDYNGKPTPFLGTEGDWRLYIADSPNGTETFFVNYASGASDKTINVGDLVTVYGYVENYQGVQMYKNGSTKPQIIQVLPGSGSQGGDTGGDTHTHNFGDSYFMYVQCTGCDVWGRNENTSKVISTSSYTFNSSAQSRIENEYNALVAAIKAGSASFYTVLDDYNTFVDELDYVGNQYQFAQVLYDVYSDGNDSYAENYYAVNNFYDVVFGYYYNLFVEFYNSTYSSDFYYGYTSQEVQELLAEARGYGDGSNQTDLNDILEEYYALLEQYYFSMDASEFNDLYGQFVTAANKLATSAGYADYMHYAYENEYGREYAPEDVAQMRNYVKQYIGPLFEQVTDEFYAAFEYDFWSGGYSYDFGNQTDDENFFYALKGNSVFDDNREAVNYIGEYFEWLSAVDTIDFSSAVNDMFKNGSYFTGVGEGAYTWYLYGVDSPICYFQASTDEYAGYDDAFTFVHEFGHYYELCHNGDITLSMDHDETQSQGDEMLFLAWLSQNKAAGIDSGFDAVELSQLQDILSTIILSTAVDEFEQAAYSGKYNGNTIGSNYDYNALFNDILCTYVDASYVESDLNSEYWLYVVFDNAAYYISYAMSALPSLEIYAKAGNSGLTSARDSYLKLFTFTTNGQFVEEDYEGYVYLKDGVTYQSILNWAGLGGPFEQSLYTTITQYFNSRA